MNSNTPPDDTGAAGRIVITPAQITDLTTILYFIRALAEYENLTHEVRVTEDLLRQFLFCDRPAAEVLIARIDERPAGYALFFQTYCTFPGRPGIWLEDLFIYPEYRRSGVGRALMRVIASITVQRNCGRLEWSVLDWNEPALDFYRRIGAEAMDDWKLLRLTGDSLARLAGSTQ